MTKITAGNLNQLTWQAKIDLLKKIVDGAISFDEVNINDDEQFEAVTYILFHVLDQLDIGDERNWFGNEGWRQSILGED